MAKPQRDGLISRFFIDVKTKIRRTRVLLEELLGSGIRLSIAARWTAPRTTARRTSA